VIVSSAVFAFSVAGADIVAVCAEFVSETMVVGGVTGTAVAWTSYPTNVALPENRSVVAGELIVGEPLANVASPYVGSEPMLPLQSTATRYPSIWTELGPRQFWGGVSGRPVGFWYASGV
jgi:hypothetical protein